MTDLARSILDLARWAPSGDNVQCWRFEIVGERHVVVHGFDTRAHVVYEPDRDCVVEKGGLTGELELIIVDEFTGRKMVGRQWSEGLHQAVEAKERVPIKQETQTLATITLQNFFKMYKGLAGMTGTAQTEAEEFHKL